MSDENLPGEDATRAYLFDAEFHARCERVRRALRIDPDGDPYGEHDLRIVIDALHEARQEPPTDGMAMAAPPTPKSVKITAQGSTYDDAREALVAVVAEGTIITENEITGSGDGYVAIVADVQPTR